MKGVAAIRCHLGAAYNHHDLIVVFISDPDLSYALLSSFVTEKIRAGLPPDDVIILGQYRLIAKLAEDFPKVRSLSAVIERLSYANVAFLGFDEFGAEGYRLSIRGTSVGEINLSLTEIYRLAITQIARNNGALLTATPVFHFKNPSGRHSSYFLKASNLLLREAEVSLIGAALLSYIGDAEFLHIDTSSLFSVVGAANDHLRSMESHRHIRCENFSSYGGVQSYEFLSDKSAVVISGSSSGSLARGIEEKCPQLKGRIFHLLFYGNGQNIVSICDLIKDEINFNGFPQPEVLAEQGCERCDQGSRCFDLSGDRFEFETKQFNASVIKRNHLPRSFDKVGKQLIGRGVFQITTAGTQGPRLHRINVGRLISAFELSPDLKFVASKYFSSNIAYAVYLDDPGSKALCIELLSLVGASADVSVLSAVEFERIDARSVTRPIVVVAGAVDSGRSLKSIALTLRVVAPQSPVTFIVGFSKMTGDALVEMKNTISLRRPLPNDVIVLASLNLPNGRHPNAWAEERQMFQDSNFADQDGVFKDRLALLLKSGDPLSDDLFWDTPSGEKLKLTPGFAFWENMEISLGEESQADVFFTISAVLQNMRNGSLDLLRNDHIQQTVLAEENFNRYNDPIIQSSILRAATPSELNYIGFPDQSAAMASLLISILSAPTTTRGGAAGEFLLALATGRMRLAPTDIQSVLNHTDVSVPGFRILVDYIHRNGAVP